MLEEIQQVTGQLAGYGSLIASILLVMFGGVIAMILLYKVASALINPAGAHARAMKVAFGTLYLIVLVITILVAAQRIGLPVEGPGRRRNPAGNRRRRSGVLPAPLPAALALRGRGHGEGQGRNGHGGGYDRLPGGGAHV